MNCKTIAILMFLAMHFVTEAKQLKNSEGIEVLSTHANIQNGSSHRSESISADITGHVLTITFNDNVGIAHIVIKDSKGGYYPPSTDKDDVHYQHILHVTYGRVHCSSVTPQLPVN